MKSFLDFLWRNASTSFLCGVLILIGGFIALQNLPESIFPQINFPKVAILVHNQNLPVNYMLVNVTQPLEQAVREEPGVKLVRSQTGNGLTKIHVYFNSNVNPETAYLILKTKIAQVHLPKYSILSVRLMRPNIYPFAEYALVSNTTNSSFMMPTFYFQVKPILLGVSGVYKVEETSRGWPEVNIHLYEKKLLRYNLSVNQISDWLIKNQGPFYSGIMNYFNQQLVLSSSLKPNSITDLSNLTIPLSDGNNTAPLKLNQIASISLESPPLIRDAKVSQYKHALIMDILYQNNVNAKRFQKMLRKQLKR